MLQAVLVFSGDGKILNFMGNKLAIESPRVERTGVGKYNIAFLSGRKIDSSKIGASQVIVQCQAPSGSGTVTNVTTSPTAEFNPNASQFPWTISFTIEVQNIAPSLLVLGPILTPVDRSVIMINFSGANSSSSLFKFPTHHEIPVVYTVRTPTHIPQLN